MSARLGGAPTPRIDGRRHARAIVLLPFMNTVVIPAVLLGMTRGSDWLGASTGSAAAWLLRFGGGVLIVAGVALVGHSIALFVAEGEGTLAPWDPARRLLTRGAYRYSRNPLKLGLFAILLGEAAVLQSLPLLAWLVLFAAINVVYIRLSEEPGLHRRFGSAYEQYCRRVPRWLPTPAAARARRRAGDLA